MQTSGRVFEIKLNPFQMQEVMELIEYLSPGRWS